jgi:hypothetical protein
VFIFVIPACSGGDTISIPTPTPTQTQNNTPSIVTTTTREILEPPSPEELGAQGFYLPELARITCEQLKNMMDNNGPFILVDTRVTLIYDLGNIPQSINIPIDMEEIDLIDRLLMLPKDKPVIFYCD